MASIDLRKYILETFQPLVLDQHKYQVLFGGRGGGKSVYVARMFVIGLMSDRRNNGVVFRQNEKDNSESTFNEIWNAIESYGDLVYEAVYEECIKKKKGEELSKDTAQAQRDAFMEMWKKTENPKKIIYRKFNNTIIFRGLNDPTSIKSIKPKSGYYTYLWLEEAQAVMRKKDFDDADKSFRGVLPEGLKRRWYITFNSPFNTHWLRDFTEDCNVKVNLPKNKFITKGFENYTFKSITNVKGTNDLAIAHYSIYSENPYLSAEDIKTYEMGKFTNPRYFEMEMLGEFGSTQGLIYTNWRVEEFRIQDIIRPEHINSKSKYVILGGLDYGFVHPTAFYMFAINKEEKKCYVFDGFSASGLLNHEIAGRIVGMGYGEEKIVCENAEPKSVEEIRRAGLRGLKVVHKYRGNDNSSIMQGVKLVMKYEIIIHSKLREFIKCMTNYCWDEDKFGRTLERPVNVGDDEATCFTGDTEIKVAEGIKRLDEIKKGDIVLSYNEETKQIEFNKVLWSGLTKKKAKLLRIEFEDGSFVRVTPEHIFLTLDGWKKTIELTTKDNLVSIGKQIEIYKIYADGEEDVYDITVDKTHTFILKNGAVVHNCMRYAIMMIEKGSISFGMYKSRPLNFNKERMNKFFNI